MRDLNACAAQCLQMLDALHIPYGTVKAFKVNTRATTRWGQCKQEPDGFVIDISSVLLDERNPKQALTETLLHELLHTCEGCQNHGRQWKLYAARVNARFGLNIKGRSGAQEKGIVADERQKAPVHAFRCRQCGALVQRQRESKFTKNYKLYRCSRCGGMFEKIF